MSPVSAGSQRRCQRFDRLRRCALRALILAFAGGMGTVGGGGCGGASAARAQTEGTPPLPSIVRLPFPPDEEQRYPVAIPTEPGNATELDFPWPVADWAGRGFTPDPENYAGDLVVDATRGSARVFVTPLVESAHRILHIVLGPSAGPARSLALEFVPAPAFLAWRKVTFLASAEKAAGSGGDAAEGGKKQPDGAAGPAAALEPAPPGSRYRSPAPEAEMGLIRTMRLLLDCPEAMRSAFLAANRALESSRAPQPSRNFGDFTLQVRLALRDQVTDSLGLVVEVANDTTRRIAFDPASWVVRAGARVYPIRTVDFPGSVEPAWSERAFLVLTRGPQGEATRLLPDNDFAVSVLPMGSSAARSVRRFSPEP